jgi:hypothetical protein
VEPDDQSNIPTKPVIVPGTGEPSQGVTDSIAAAMFGVKRPAGGGGWQPPSTEELQGDFPLYEIRGILGRGGMGAVYKGWQKSLGRLVAIKILPPGLDDGIAGFAERFKREAKAMAQLEHPGIVAVYDAGSTPSGLLYFVMQCIEGTDVQRLVSERGRLDPGEALRITSAVCDALGYAHGHGLIHRDIKPSNIMLDAHGAVKVADFGLAKSTAPETTLLTGSNIAMGTPEFMAPEALKGAAEVDHRADLYAVGVMLYQMLTGEIPRGRFVPPSRAVPGLDRRLDPIVDRALQPDRAQRYSTAIELRTAIEPVTRSMAKRTASLARAAASRKKPALIALAAIAVVAIGAVAYFAPWKKVEGASSALPKASKGLEAPSTVSAAVPSPFPPGQWTKVLLNEEDIRGFVGVSDGFMTRKPGVPSARVPAASGRNAGVRARFRRDPAGSTLPQLMLRNDDAGAGYNIHLSPGGLVFRRNDNSAKGSNVELKRFPMPVPQPGQEFTFAFIAIGQTLIARLDGQTVSMQLDPAENPQLSGRIRLYDVEHNAFRDVEVLNLDGLPEAEALKLAGLSEVSKSPTLPASQSSTSAAATKDAPFENTLGMKFVPVPITGGPTGGERVLFSVWETRVMDYRVFARETKRFWTTTGIPQDPTHPVVRMNWADTQAFCLWLTERERKASRIGATERYRLPTDHEWSCAVGIGGREDPDKLPEEKRDKIPDVFPWGAAWPPPPGSGNFSGEETAGHHMENQRMMSDFRDDFPYTAPVGSFTPNALGLHDLAGNVQEWCESWFDQGQTKRVSRGRSWYEGGGKGVFVSSSRSPGTPGTATAYNGFRIVLAKEKPGAKAAGK